MARIPRIEPGERQLTTEAATRKTDVQAAGAEAGALATLGGVAEDVANQLTQAQDLAERTRAENQRQQRVNDLESQAQTDTDFSEERRQFYVSEMEKARTESSKEISLPGSKARYQNESKTKNQISQIRIDNVFRTKQRDNARAEYTRFLENKRDEYIEASSPAMMAMAVKERDSYLTELVKIGAIDRDQAETQRQSEHIKWQKQRAINRLKQDPDEVLADLALGEEGPYDALSPEIRKSLETSAEQQKEKNEQDRQKALKRQQVSNSNDLYAKYGASLQPGGEVLTLQEVLDAFEVDPETGERGLTQTDFTQLMNIVTAEPTKVKPTPEQARDFIETESNLFNSLYDENSELIDDNFAGVEIYRKHLASMHESGVITDEQYFTKLDFTTPEHLEFLSGPRSNIWKEVKDRVIAHMNVLDPFRGMRLYGEMLSTLMGKAKDTSVSDGQLVEAAEKLIAQSIKRENANRSIYKKGDKISLPSGTYEVIGFYPDGEPEVALSSA